MLRFTEKQHENNAARITAAGSDRPAIPAMSYMDTPAAAKYLQTSTRTLEMLRSRGGGPKWVRISRAVRYRPDWLDAWAEQNAVVSTSEETARRRV
jgi:hypothetical protein